MSKKDKRLNSVERILSRAVGAGVATSVTTGIVAAVGTAGTGTAISTLSGVAATRATLAVLGGGTLAAGGLGIAGGAVVLGGIGIAGGIVGPHILKKLKANNVLV